MKVAVIGGGSSYTPELVNGFLERVKSFPLTELWLVDIERDSALNALSEAGKLAGSLARDFIPT